MAENGVLCAPPPLSMLPPSRRGVFLNILGI